MACPTELTISDGTTTVNVSIYAFNGTYRISKELIAEGVTPWRAADGSGGLDVRWQKRRYTIDGAGDDDPGLWSLSLTAATWTVTIPGFANGAANEVWTVVPARPSESRDRLNSRGRSWTLTLEEA